MSVKQPLNLFVFERQIFSLFVDERAHVRNQNVLTAERVAEAVAYRFVKFKRLNLRGDF